MADGDNDYVYCSSRGMNGSTHQSGPPTKPDRVQVIQHCGILQKQPFGQTNQSTRWAKRFFIVKDGFLLYYNENEKKEYDKSQVMNLHPKGVLPLGGCCVEESSDPTHPFCIQIKSVDTQNSFLLSADNDIVRRKWVEVLQQASRITLRNAKLGDAMIQQLEKQGLEMAEEKQKYFDKYKVETQQSEAHKIRAQELEKMNQELERRRLQLENSVFDMKKEYDEMQKQLQETAAAARNVEEMKLKLQDQTMQLQKNLEELELEKSQIVDDFKRQQVESLELSKEKENLSEKTQQLNAKLNDIELKMKKVSAEKSLAELSFKEQELKSRQLLEDNMNIGQYAQQLNESLKALNDQKNATEVELREEVTARMEAEKRLHEAEESLGRLEAALDRQQQLLQQRTVEKDADDAMTQMIGDVNTLKKFFENVTFEAKIDARKGLMIKQSIEAKKAVVRRTRTVLLDNLHLDFTQPPPTNPNIARRFAPLTSFLSMDPDPEGAPSSPSSTVDPFQRKAERCLQNPNSRHSAFALLQSIDLQDLTKEQNV